MSERNVPWTYRPCALHVSGYKMFVRAYLDGDGSGKSTHLSLFFVLARGNFDALLRWPFNQRVTMTLLDQVRQSVSQSLAASQHACSQLIN